MPSSKMPACPTNHSVCFCKKLGSSGLKFCIKSRRGFASHAREKRANKKKRVVNNRPIVFGTLQLRQSPFPVKSTCHLAGRPHVSKISRTNTRTAQTNKRARGACCAAGGAFTFEFVRPKPETGVTEFFIPVKAQQNAQPRAARAPEQRGHRLTKSMWGP